MQSLKQCQNINEIRTEIDFIDREIISLISKRSGYVKKAASFKTDSGSVKAPERVKKMIEQRRAWASEENVDQELIEKLFLNMVDHFIKKEMKEFNSNKR